MKYVYTHSINGKIFYVGCGSGNRPYNDKSRNRVWHTIVNDNNGLFDIDIVFESHDKHEALLEESKLIMSLLPKANLGGKDKLYKQPINKNRQPIKTEDVNQNMSIKPAHDQHLTVGEAAKYLKCSNSYLNKSRLSGLLFGQPAPAFVKVGRSIRYKPVTLLKWLNQFKETEAKK